MYYILWNQTMMRVENATSIYPTLEDAEGAIERLRASRVQRTTWSADQAREVASEEVIVPVEVPV